MKYDVMEKIPIPILLKAIRAPNYEPHLLLNKYKLINSVNRISYFEYGRDGFYFLFKKLKVNKITFPAFICPTIVKAAVDAGKNIELIDIDLETFNINLNKIPKDCECLFVIHTFGNPLNLKNFKKTHPKTLLIEDCAHSIGAKVSNINVGIFGDIVFYSLYKQVPNFSGSILITKNIDLSVIDKTKFDINIINLLSKISGPWQYVVDQIRSAKYIKNQDRTNYQKNQTPNLVKRIFNLQLPNLILTQGKKRKIWQWYEEAYKNSIYFDTQKILVNHFNYPYVFTLRLKPEHFRFRDKLIVNLRKQKIFLDKIWFNSPINDPKNNKYQKNCPNAIELTKGIINLPINIKYQKTDIQIIFIKINDELQRLINIKYYQTNIWNNFLLKNHNSTFYHRFEWFDVLKIINYQNKSILGLHDKKLNLIFPIFGKKTKFTEKFISNPIGDYSGPVGNKEKCFQFINLSINKVKKDHRQLRIFDNQKYSKQRYDFVYYELGINTYQNLWQKSFHKKTRNMVRKAEKSQLKVGISQDINKFYELYLQTMRKLGQLPIPKKIYIKTKELFNKETLLFSVVKNDKEIGFLWCFNWKKTLWIWANATDSRYLNLGSNYALYNKAIEFACNNKIKMINFGSSKIDSQQAFFKKRWGGIEKPIYLYQYPENPHFSEEYSLLSTIIKILPPKILELVGNIAYKYL